MANLTAPRRGFLRLGRLAAFLVACLVLGCEILLNTNNLVPPGDGGIGDGGQPTNQCSAACNPPTCCLSSCSDGGSCCKGTTCLTDSSGGSKCYPTQCQKCGGMTPFCSSDSSCAANCIAPPTCGQTCTSSSTCGADSECHMFSSGAQLCVPLGFQAACNQCSPLDCTFNSSNCTVTCAQPNCCLAPCGTGCCAGTSCLTASDGTQACYPTGCQSCGGMTPLCESNSNCSVTCIAPPTCGQACTSSTNCGIDSTCFTFQNGEAYCVPQAFQTVCNACGTAGCVFYPETCSSVCQEPDGGSCSFDGGSGAADGGGSDSGAIDSGPPPPACLACCQPCHPDGGAACCEGNVCLALDGGAPQCVPSLCQSMCDYGCNYRCP
jgi:hypothetical protein